MESSAEKAEVMAGVQWKGKGGLKTIPFIISNEVLEKVASYGLHANMIIYLTRTYHMAPATGATVLLCWGALSNFTPVLGAFLADSWLGRFRVIALSCIVGLIVSYKTWFRSRRFTRQISKFAILMKGMVLLWMTAMVPGAQPPACEEADADCRQLPPTSSQLALLFGAFVVMSIGSGGIRPCSLAFGADQFRTPGAAGEPSPENVRTLQTFFNWYYASVGVSLMVALTVIVYIQDHKGWRIGFAVPVALMSCSTVLFLLGSTLYVKKQADKSILSGLAQVAVVSLKNRYIILPSDSSATWFHKSKGSKLSVPTKNLRFLNKACVIRNPEKDLNASGEASSPWRLCTVEQVEVFKAVARVLPLWSTGIMPAVVISQTSFPVLQAGTMDRHMGPHFQVPAASFIVFSIIMLTLWVAVYDRLLVPPLARLTGRPRGLSLKQRMGVGLAMSVGAMAAAAVTEHARRIKAIEESLLDRPTDTVHMSAMWLVPQYCLIGLAEAFNTIGQVEFYYSEFPKSMGSIGISLVALGLGAGNLAGSLIIVLINKMSRAGGRASWVDRNLNMGRYDYYYWLLTVLSFANIFYFLFCSQAYGEEGSNKFWEEETKTADEEKRSREPR